MYGVITFSGVLLPRILSISAGMLSILIPHVHLMFTHDTFLFLNKFPFFCQTKVSAFLKGLKSDEKI